MELLWITVLPLYLVQLLGPLSLMLIGYLVEKKYVGRITIFANTLALNLHVFNLINPPLWLVWYANLGIFFGVIGLLAYPNVKLTKEYYKASYLYSSIPVGVIILAFY